MPSVTAAEWGINMNRLFLGVEIGATKHQVAIGTQNGELLCVIQGRVVLEDGAEGILSWMKHNISGLISRESGFGGKVAGIGVGFGGIVETSAGGF